MGDNMEGARRIGINIAGMHYLAYGWMGIMAGIAGLMQAHYAQEVVPNAMYGRELEVLAAVVLGELAFAMHLDPLRPALILLSGVLTVASAAAYLVAWLRHMSGYGEGSNPDI
jgi:ABC-type glucose/galactose transport system permease subunit